MQLNENTYVCVLVRKSICPMPSNCVHTQKYVESMKRQSNASEEKIDIIGILDRVSIHNCAAVAGARIACMHVENRDEL